MTLKTINKGITIIIAVVWLTNGLLCKVLDLVPRHKAIVSEILGSTYAGILTILIGLLEVLIAVWVISSIKSRWCAILQIATIITMNILESLITPDLLLWGRYNITFALLFAFLIYYNTFVLAKKNQAIHEGVS